MCISRKMWQCMGLSMFLLGGAACDNDDDNIEEKDCSIDTDGDGLTDCEEESDYGTDPNEADTDNDGLSDGDEVLTHGSDPNQENSDGDDYTDQEEIACGTDPTDENEHCYACGWTHNDPGNLVTTGSAVGDTISNIPMVDQCQEEVFLWDLAGEYHILFMTAAW
jgi:hypothetical protein